MILIIAAVAVYFVLSKDKEDPNEVTFLIEDNQSVYFWITGTGETAADAVKDAADKSAVVLGYDDGQYGMYIWGINGLEQAETYSDGSWALYLYEDGEWIYSAENGVSGIKSADYEYMALFYVTSDPVTFEQDLPDNIPDVKDAKAWDQNTDGTVFAIQSSTGLYFYINGSGETVYDALVDADSKYNIGFVGSDNLSGKGVQSMFGLEMNQVDETWFWWSTYVLTEDQSEWESSSFYPGNILSEDNPQICFIYKYSDGPEPTVPVYE